MENYKVVRCCVDVYVPVDNIDQDNLKDPEDLEEELRYSTIDSIENAIKAQTENPNSVLYQSYFQVYEAD